MMLKPITLQDVDYGTRCQHCNSNLATHKVIESRVCLFCLTEMVKELLPLGKYVAMGGGGYGIDSELNKAIKLMRRNAWADNKHYEVWWVLDDKPIINDLGMICAKATPVLLYSL